jgi:hypothetical protein
MRLLAMKAWSRFCFVMVGATRVLPRYILPEINPTLFLHLCKRGHACNSRVMFDIGEENMATTSKPKLLLPNAAAEFLGRKESCGAQKLRRA